MFLLGCRKDSHSYRKIVPASVLPHVRRSQIDHYLLARNPEAQRLKGSHCPQKALLDSHIRKSDQMYSYSMRYVHLHGDGDSLDTDALCPKNVYQHSLSSLCTLAKMAQQNVNFQKKQKFRHKKQK